MLVCTTIIESGIDIPQANTLIVERADLFGLAQLYQIRGRVGRCRERAYAYLLYPSAAALTEEAAQRLAALSDYTELGAGFKIAMRDLEIRGAGNLLGDEQSGHVAALGFELYMPMLDEAVRRLARRRRPSEDGRAGAPRRQRRRLRARPTTSPTSRPRSTSTGASPAPREVADLDRAARGARGPLRPAAGAAREPDRAAAGADQARPGRRARSVDFRGGRLASRRSSSTRARAKSAARARCRRRSTSPGRSTVSRARARRAGRALPGGRARRRRAARGGTREPARRRAACTAWWRLC